MSLIKFLKAEEAKDWFYNLMPSSSLEIPVEMKEVEAGSEYISISLKSMRIVNVRKGLYKFYGTVHSNIKVPYRTGDHAVFTVISTPSKLYELDAKNIDRVISQNIPLLGPIPYRGGRIEMEIGLLSIKAEDLTEPVLSLLNNISNLAGVSFIGSAMHYIEPLKKGVEILTGSDEKNVLEIGLSTSYEKIITGDYVLMRASADEVDDNELRLDKNCRLVNVKGENVKDYPYLVFEITSTKHRSDYFSIPEIAKAYKALQEEVKKMDKINIQDALAYFKRTVLTSNDLIFRDSKIIYQEVEDEIKEILELTKEKERGSGIINNWSLKDLEEYQLFNNI